MQDIITTRRRITMVAKSFQSMTQMCEPFVENGRMYVNVKNETISIKNSLKILFMIK